MGTFQSGDKYVIPTYKPLIPKGKRGSHIMLTRGSIFKRRVSSSTLKQFMSNNYL